MNTFFYFFPSLESVASVTPELLTACGLARVLGPGVDVQSLVGSGPGGAARGVTVSPGPTPVPAFDEVSQTWTECADGKFWLGYTTANRPGPADLIHPDIVDGYAVTLGDGNDWTIPAVIIHGGDCQTALPEVMRLDSSGKTYREPAPRFAKLREYAATALAGFKTLPPFNEPGDVMITEDFKPCACIEALATNYRVGKWEVEALGLLSRANWDIVLAAMVDLKGLWATVSQPVTA